MNILADAIISDWQETIFKIVGGLGIFLYGIKIMGDSLKGLAGNKLKLIIEKSTNTPLKGVIVGIIITGLIQSSSGTTAITVGLVRAGLMTLPQAVGIILGANIGTTITSFLIGLKIKAYALPIMAIGSFLIFFVTRKKLKLLGGTLLGFGMLFYGLDIMGGELKLLVKLPEFAELLKNTAKWPPLGVLVGALTTAVVQSSSATMGILQSLYETGELETKGAIAILLGNNIGTTITAVLAALGGSIAAKRTAAAHVLFNVIGSLIFLILITPYSFVISWIEKTYLSPNDPMTIFFGHFGFNLINTIIFLVLVNQLVAVVKFVVRGEDETIKFDASSLDDTLIDKAPVLALENAKNIIYNMGLITRQMLEFTIKYSFENNVKYIENGLSIEETLDTIDKKTHDFLVKIAQKGLDLEASQLQAEYVDTIRDFERIGDHCVNIFQFFEQRYDDKVELSVDANTELKKLYDVVEETIQLTLDAFNQNDKEIAKKVLDREDIIDKLVIKNRKRHIRRINNNESTETQDELYVDILSNIERIGDHCNNIAINVLQESYYNEELDYEY